MAQYESINDYYDTRWLDQWPADRDFNGFALMVDHISDLYRSARRAHRSRRYTRRAIRAHLSNLTSRSL